LLAANTLEDPLEQRTVPRLIEVEFASDSVPDLGFTKAGLAAELQQRISDVRAHLKSDPGFILSGINFKDNVSFERGQFRFLIRGVPLPVERLSFEAPQSEQWDEMARRIQEVAFNNAARFYTSQDCSAKLSEISTPDGVDYSDIQNDSDSLFALSWVLKALLSERAPISDFASIVAEFRRCRSRNLGLVTTVEEIRSLPQIRKRLPGNSLDPAPAIRSLSQDLEDRMYSAIDWNCSEPILNAPPEIRQEVRSLALKAKIEAGKHCAVLLTSPAARPFARKMIEGIDVNVLSRREVLSALLSRIKDSDAAGRTQLHSKAGN
jgi:flagellar biosynthesis component FlhA